MARGRHSLSRRLLFGMVIASLVCWSAVAWLTVRDSVNEVYELFDVNLAQTALAILRVTDPDDTDPVVIPNRAEPPALGEIFDQWPELPDRLAKLRAASTKRGGPAAPAAPVVTGSIHSMHAEYEKNLRYQVWSSTGSLLLRSGNAPATAMTDRDGYSETTDAQGRLWRHYGVWDKHRDFRILVSEAHELRTRLVRNIATHAVSPLALGLPVLIVLLWFAIATGLRPLRVLTHEIQTREPETLTPLDEGSAPREVLPMVGALNHLLQRMARTLEGERRFTANAAHELRTPLAAIQAQLHVARNAEGEVERQHAMDQLQRGVERGIRLVSQMLTLARLDPDQALPDVQPVNIREVAEQVCAELAPLALQRRQTLELNLAPDLPSVAGNADMLSMLLCNLIDNAIRYTQPGGQIDVAVHCCESGLLIEVSDNGPGIPLAQRERVFDRFYRIAGHEQNGTGLGLAICRRIAELHGTHISLMEGPEQSGVTARVVLSVAQG